MSLPSIVNQQARATNNRLHGVDALRAVAMLLGVILHAMIPYKVEGLPNWPADSQLHHWLFDYTYSLIHSFRMPLFFFIAGFFCSMQFQKNGMARFVNNRLKRIILPFGVSVLVLLPLTVLPFLYYRNTTLFPSGNVWAASCRGLLHWNGLAHLWFLYYLILYYILFLVFATIWQRFAGLAIKRKRAGMVHMLVLLVTAVMILFVLHMGTAAPYLEVDTGLLPEPAFPLYYLIFFVGGNMLYHNAHCQEVYKKRAGVLTGLGLLLHVPIFCIVFYKFSFPFSALFIRGVAVVQVMLLVLGCMGLALKTNGRNRAILRYASDASYWVYLVHLGVTAGVQTALLETDVPGVFRFWIVLFATLLFALGSYHFFVRFTFLGRVLHGKRERSVKTQFKSAVVVPG